MKITLKFLNDLIVKNNIPETATLQSDSGWECGETDCESVYYNQKENTIILCGERNGLNHREGCIQLFADDYVEESDGIWNYIVDRETKMVHKERIYEVNIPESFIRNIKCRSTLSEYNDWAEYLKKELEDMYIDVLRNGIREGIETDVN